MTGLRAIGLVAGRELMDRLRNRAFMAGTLVTLLLVLGAIIVPALFADDGPESFTLGVVGDFPPSFAATLDVASGADEVEVELADLSDEDDAAAAVRDGDVDAVLIDGSSLMAEDASPPGLLRGLVEAALQQVTLADELDRLGITDEEAARILSPREPLTVVDAAGEVDDAGPLGWAMAFMATVLLFIAIQINASSLLTGAIEEKSSRVVEVLLGTLRPRHLLAGKLVAMTALALGQVALVVAAALGANAVVGLFETPPATVPTVVTGLVMIVVGFLFYAALYAVAGSLASSVEDAQAAAGPLAFLVVGTYMIVLFAVVPAPRGLLAQVLTFLPPTAPFTVPARVALGAIPLWQVVVATVVTMIGTVLTVRLAGRLYAAAILAGGRLTWRDAWRAEPVR